MTWDRKLEATLRRQYAAMPKTEAPAEQAAPLSAGGFLTEVAGKVILTAPAASLTVASELPEGMRERWEQASEANPYMQWIHGRFVEAEKANKNGAYWSTADLQFGEMSVKHGPLNWLHEGRKVVGSIADNALIQPPVQQFAASISSTANTFNIASAVARPYIAAVSAVWRWLYPDEAKVIAKSSDENSLYYSMECVAQKMQCVEAADAGGSNTGCGQEFDYFTAMTDPTSTCEHIQQRSSVRRMVNPSFLGGAVIVPPTRPGWGDANASVMRHAAQLAADVAPANAATSQWELLMASVLAYAAQ